MKLQLWPLWHRACAQMAHKAGARVGPVSVPTPVQIGLLSALHGRARSHRYYTGLKVCEEPVGAGLSREWTANTRTQ
ncbi:hypothetical protein C1X73_17775 [Pseudomonas sp. FW305-130]|nr:hypothetical protein C1X74_09035 [Pseudomonas sp. GW460-5]PNB56946.1 hypothetical protein C1X73_17775 [Pseudomonas sp. FW305-130]